MANEALNYILEAGSQRAKVIESVAGAFIASREMKLREKQFAVNTQLEMIGLGLREKELDARLKTQPSQAAELGALRAKISFDREQRIAQQAKQKSTEDLIQTQYGNISFNDSWQDVIKKQETADTNMRAFQDEQLRSSFQEAETMPDILAPDEVGLGEGDATESGQYLFNGPVSGDPLDDVLMEVSEEGYGQGDSSTGPAPVSQREIYNLGQAADVASQTAFEGNNLSKQYSEVKKAADRIEDYQIRNNIVTPEIAVKRKAQFLRKAQFEMAVQGMRGSELIFKPNTPEDIKGEIIRNEQAINAIARKAVLEKGSEKSRLYQDQLMNLGLTESEIAVKFSTAFGQQAIEEENNQRREKMKPALDAQQDLVNTLVGQLEVLKSSRTDSTQPLPAEYTTIQAEWSAAAKELQRLRSNYNNLFKVGTDVSAETPDQRAQQYNTE